jgi:hypothetical protein
MEKFPLASSAIRGSVALLWLCWTASPISAALLAYEPFDYQAGLLLVGKGGGFGFGGPWTEGGFSARLFDQFKVKAGGLSLHKLATRGTNHVVGEAVLAPESGIAGLGRSFTNVLGEPGTTFYLSYLFRPDTQSEYTSVVIGTGSGDELSIGKSGALNVYGLSQRGGTGRVPSNVPVTVGQTVFLVIRMEFKEGPDIFTLYVNPEPGKPEPVSSAIKNDFDLGEADSLFLYSRGDWSVDEIRLGTKWNDVTPVGSSGR